MKNKGGGDPAMDFEKLPGEMRQSYFSLNFADWIK